MTEASNLHSLAAPGGERGAAGTVDRLALMASFVRIVEAGSLSATAAQLGTTQPTVSRQLQALERSLGLRLLQRSTHTMLLTEDGQRCFERAKALLATPGRHADTAPADPAPIQHRQPVRAAQRGARRTRRGGGFGLGRDGGPGPRPASALGAGLEGHPAARVPALPARMPHYPARLRRFVEALRQTMPPSLAD